MDVGSEILIMSEDVFFWRATELKLRSGEAFVEANTLFITLSSSLSIVSYLKKREDRGEGPRLKKPRTGSHLLNLNGKAA